MLKELSQQEKRVNKLYILTNKVYKNIQKVVVKCDCGRYKKIQYRDIVYGKSKTCGRCSLMKNKIGDKIGELELIGYHNLSFRCKCSCGKIRFILSSKLNQGAYKTCGDRIHTFGENNSNWKGGIRNKSNSLRKSKKYKEWRTKCFERDNYTCQISGLKGGKLVVHHLSPFRLLWNDLGDTIEELDGIWDIDNGITITKELHNQFHKTYGVKDFTKEDFLEFAKTIKK